MSAIQIKKVNWWHERLADWMICNPSRTLKEAAKEFNCTIPWIYALKNSDAFKAYWIERSGDASDRIVSGVVEKTGALAELALDRMLERMNSPGEVLPTPLLLQTIDTSLKRLGYTSPARPPANSAASSPSPSVTVNVAVVSAEQLAAARERMKVLHGIDVAPTRELLEVTGEGE